MGPARPGRLAQPKTGSQKRRGLTKAKPKGTIQVSEPGVRELLQAGLHFGHQTRRWNPRMRPYIHGEHDGIHIIDLLQTEHLLAEARRFAAEVAGKGGSVLFVGTKKQARDSVQEWAERCGMPYVNKRWLGGLLTNFNTMSKRIDRLHDLRTLKDRRPARPAADQGAHGARVRAGKARVQPRRRRRHEARSRSAVFVVDLKTEAIAVAEAKRLRLPIIGLVDSNVDPVPVDFPVPGNDDAIRSCSMVIGTIGEAVEEAAGNFRAAEQKRRADEEAKRQREAEEKAAREAEDAARREEQEAEMAASQAAKAQAAAAGRRCTRTARSTLPRKEAPSERHQDLSEQTSRRSARAPARR